MIDLTISELTAALSRLSNAEFLAALGMSLAGFAALTWIGLLYRAPGRACTAGSDRQRADRGRAA